MIFVVKINPVQYILCSQYILADRFSKNSGYLDFVNFWVSVFVKGSVEKSKNTDVSLSLTVKWQC